VFATQSHSLSSPDSCCSTRSVVQQGVLQRWEVRFTAAAGARPCAAAISSYRTTGFNQGGQQVFHSWRGLEPNF
jgi:hypothetical protein